MKKYDWNLFLIVGVIMGIGAIVGSLLGVHQNETENFAFFVGGIVAVVCCVKEIIRV